MEEILASIRRIIADDQAAKPAEVAAPAPEPDDVLDLAEVAEPVMRPRVVEPEPEPEPAPDLLDFDAIDFEDPVIAAPEPEPEPEPEPAPEPPPPPPPPPQPVLQAARAPEPEPEALVSPATDASVSGAFNLLAHTVLTQNARTLEDLVKEMLRPMLKSWLDDNLPAVVERLVRAEIERVSRGR
ncbi:PopZ family protein [Methylobacterium sp. NPDC080182]|uniref:PopZ family protein n=1 Tax=Methylobacterium TaxID=407 RepID=UPI002F2D19EC